MIKLQLPVVSTLKDYRPDDPFGSKHVASLIMLYLMCNMFVLRYVHDHRVTQKCDVLCGRRKSCIFFFGVVGGGGGCM